MNTGTSAAKAAGVYRETHADQAIRQCLDLMTSGQWIHGLSAAKLAEQHGVHIDTAKEWATTARRIVRTIVDADDVETWRAQMLLTLGTIVARSMGAREDGEHGSEVVSPRDHKTAIAAIDTQAKLLGIYVQRHEVQATPADLAKLVEEASALLGAK